MTYSRRKLISFGAGLGTSLLGWTYPGTKGRMAAHADPGHGRPTIEIDDFLSGTPVVKVKVGDKGVYPFYFDTGAVESIDAYLADLAKIIPDGEINVAAVTNETARAGQKSSLSLTAGGVALADWAVAILRQSLNNDPSAPHGAIGLGVLRHLVTTIDVEGRKIVCSDPKSYTPPRGGTVLAMLPHEQGGIVTAKIGGVEGRFLIDSGAPGLVLLYKSFWEKKGLRGRYPGTERVNMGHSFTGPINGYFVRGDRFEIGGHILPKPLMALLDDEGEAWAGDGFAGSINASLLKFFRVTIDWAGARVALERNSRKIGQDTWSYPGLAFLYSNGRAFVAEVAPKGPGESLGVQVGDEILEIGGHSVRSLGELGMFNALWERPPAGSTSLHLRGPDGDRTVSAPLHDWL